MDVEGLSFVTYRLPPVFCKLFFFSFAGERKRVDLSSLHSLPLPRNNSSTRCCSVCARVYASVCVHICVYTKNVRVCVLTKLRFFHFVLGPVGFVNTSENNFLPNQSNNRPHL